MQCTRTSCSPTCKASRLRSVKWKPRSMCKSTIQPVRRKNFSKERRKRKRQRTNERVGNCPQRLSDGKAAGQGGGSLGQGYQARKAMPKGWSRRILLPRPGMLLWERMWRRSWNRLPGERRWSPSRRTFTTGRTSIPRRRMCLEESFGAWQKYVPEKTRGTKARSVGYGWRARSSP